MIFLTKWIFLKSKTNTTKTKKNDFLVKKIDFFSKKKSKKRALYFLISECLSKGSENWNVL